MIGNYTALAATSLDDLYERGEDLLEVRAQLARMTRRTQQITKMVYGFDDEPMTRAQCGQALGINAASVGAALRHVYARFERHYFPERAAHRHSQQVRIAPPTPQEIERQRQRDFEQAEYTRLYWLAYNSKSVDEHQREDNDPFWLRYLADEDLDGMYSLARAEQHYRDFVQDKAKKTGTKPPVFAGPPIACLRWFVAQTKRQTGIAWVDELKQTWR